MPKMTNPQARKRLREAYQKILKVHISHTFIGQPGRARLIDLKDMQIIEKIILKAMNRMK